MTETSAPWELVTTGDATVAPYSSTEWAHLWALRHGAGAVFPNYGILQGTGNATYDPVQVIAAGGAVVDVKIGSALVNGRLYETTAVVALTVNSNSSGNPRIDTVILRADYTAQTIRAVIKQGTPAVSPVRPTLQQDTSIWETPLADVAVANGFASITQPDITDRRRAVQSTGSGWQPYAYPLNYIPNGVYSTNAANPRGLAFPIVITGNMMVEQVVLRSLTTTGVATFKWGIFAENLNDVTANDEILRMIGGWLNTFYSLAVTSGANFTLPAETPFFLSPGHYWLIVENQNPISFPTITPTTFDAATNKMFANAASGTISQTMDITGWSKSPDSYAARLEGRVFGEATVF